MRIPTGQRPPNENATANAVAFFSATGSFPINARQPAELRALPRWSGLVGIAHPASVVGRSSWPDCLHDISTTEPGFWAIGDRLPLRAKPTHLLRSFPHVLPGPS